MPSIFSSFSSYRYLCSKEFIELLFEHPYSKIEHLEFKGIAKRKTSGKYLAELAEIGILEPQKIWHVKLFQTHLSNSWAFRTHVLIRGHIFTYFAHI